MNGRDLSQDHLYPVRAIVPGHYGMASVKWLTRIYAVREPFQGYWQTSDYGYWDYPDGMPVRRALRTCLRMHGVWWWDDSLSERSDGGAAGAD